MGYPVQKASKLCVAGREGSKAARTARTSDLPGRWSVADLEGEVRAFDPLAVDVPRLLAELGVEARHGGDRWIATCPSGRHPDRSPSWEILDRPGEDKHGLHTCRSCHWGGTALDLVRHRLGVVGTAEAVRWIVEHALGSPRSLERLVLRVKPAGRPPLTLPPDVLVLPIDQWAATPRDYFLNDRNLPAWQVDRWGIGYAVAGELRGRIVFPSRDHRGVLLNYTARTFVGAMVRYKSCQEKEGPDPGAVFGELRWPRIDARSRRTVFVTEGAMNALSIEAALSSLKVDGFDSELEFPAVAALSGSKVQLEQVVKVASFGRAVLLTDPDPAGDAARERLEGALCRHLDVVHLRLPVGTDPNKMPRNELLGALTDVGVRG